MSEDRKRQYNANYRASPKGRRTTKINSLARQRAIADLIAKHVLEFNVLLHAHKVAIYAEEEV